MTQAGKRILLVIGGGIAAYKSLDLIRRLRERGFSVRCVMTEAAAHFVTPLSVGTVAADQVFTALFDRSQEHDVGHIRLSREADLVVVAPATADLMAKLANGLANDLASAVLLATDKPVLMAPAMNPRMWAHAGDTSQPGRAGGRRGRLRRPGNRRNGGAQRSRRGPHGRAAGDRRRGRGAAVAGAGPLAGRSIIVTSGPTHEPIDPVRYIANRSSGKQGHAIAAALARLRRRRPADLGAGGAARPAGVETVHVETAREMRGGGERGPARRAAVLVAAVADWRTEQQAGAEDQEGGEAKLPPALKMVENPDILARRRPRAAPALSGGRLRRRDRSAAQQCRGQAGQQGRRLDRRQRCQPGGDGGRQEPGGDHRQKRSRDLAGTDQGRGGGSGSPP